MANNNPPEHTRFKKGVSGNPGGKPKGLLTIEVLKKAISKHLALSKDELKEVLNDKDSTALDLVVASTISKAIGNGDIAKVEYLFNRALGKVKDTIEVVQPEPVVIKRLNGEEVSLQTKLEENK